MEMVSMNETQNFSSPYPHFESQSLFLVSLGLCQLQVHKHSPNRKSESWPAQFCVVLLSSAPSPDLSAPATAAILLFQPLLWILPFHLWLSLFMVLNQWHAELFLLSPCSWLQVFLFCLSATSHPLCRALLHCSKALVRSCHHPP